MIDIHSHILPGIDDGSKNMDMSLAMLKMAEENGTKTIVATPHYIKNRYENEFDGIFNLYMELKLEAKAAGLNIEILLGQEIMLDSYSLELIKSGRLKGLDETRYILIEFPMDIIPKDAFNLIYELKLLSYIPILAHPERYIYIYQDITKINDFIQEGCYFQTNTGSLQGIFGKKVQDCAKHLVEHGIVNFIASDTHSLKARNPSLTEGFEVAKTIDKDIITKVSTNLRMMLSNEELNLNIEKIKKKKTIFSFFSNNK